jgi:hypothetical protein
MELQHIEQVKANVERAIKRHNIKAQITFTPDHQFTVSAKTSGVRDQAIAALKVVPFIKHVESDQCERFGSLAYYEIREFMI